jgi:serine/threonine protein phosphatase 1
MKTFVIGDIHGADKALEQVLQRAGVTKDDKLIFLGDYVDGWSGSAKVIDRLIALDLEMDCIFIKGNHDEWCEQWLDDETVEQVWWVHGGKATIESYAEYSEEKKLQHLVFFNRMRNYYTDELNRLFVHAGFSSMHGPGSERYETNFAWDRTLWEMALSMNSQIKKDSSLYPKRLKLFTEIFIGHTPTLNYNMGEPMNAINVWNIDTGAAFYGKLTIMDIDTKEFWQSDRVQTLYPGEKGRNKD